jgi:hypothetical protein
MERVLLPLALLAALPIAAFAQDTVPDAHRDALAFAFMEYNCTVNDTNEEAILAASGLTEDEAAAVVFQWVSEGAATPNADGSLTLIIGPCAD